MTATPSQPATERLLAEFPEPAYGDWRKLVEAELKGAAFDKKMFTTTAEGITLKPIYQAGDIAALPQVHSLPGFAPFVRGTKASGYTGEAWEVAQEITEPSPEEFNLAALNSASRGLTALNIVVDEATRRGNDPDFAGPNEVGVGGLSVASLADLKRALTGLDLEKTSLFIRTGASALPFAALLAALARDRMKSFASLRGCIEMDPLGVLAHEGKLPQSLNGAYREMAALTQWAAEHTPQLQTICVHSRPWHDAGGNAVEELAFTLATALDYFRALNERGVDIDTAAPQTRLAISVGANFFTEIAKLRALRMLWARLVASLGGQESAQKATLHVRTARWNKTTYDPYNNLLRSTVEAFAGVLGGADSLQVGPFDETVRPADDFSRRLARNTQLILQKECLLSHVVDPAGGSWYVESLTNELAQRAWKLFQEVEQLGGMAAALRVGFPQKRVASSAMERIKAVTRRRDSIVGINQYANPKEKPLARNATEDPSAFHRKRARQVAAHREHLDEQDSATVLKDLARVVEAEGQTLFPAILAAAKSGATLGELTRSLRIHDAAPESITPVCLTRAAAPLEGLRAAMDRQPERAKVFLCNMGSLKEFKARADFSRGFFSVGGFDVVSPAGFKTPQDAAAAFAASGARIAVICSTDDNYPALVPALVPLLQAAVPGAINVLAGYPPEQVEALKKAGIDEFIHVRADVLETLRLLQLQLGIS